MPPTGYTTSHSGRPLGCAIHSTYADIPTATWQMQFFPVATGNCGRFDFYCVCKATQAPTPSPTPSPTSAPTSSPIPAPTPSPTPSPTSAPTSSPTPANNFPQSGLCPAGYHWQAGILPPTLGDCPETLVAGWCVVSCQQAFTWCDSSADCGGVSELDRDWTNSGTTCQALGQGEPTANGNWQSCVKATQASGWSLSASDAYCEGPVVTGGTIIPIGTDTPSAAECGAAVLEDSDCGDYMVYYNPRPFTNCYCVRKGFGCDMRSSSTGGNVYTYQAFDLRQMPLLP